MSASERVTQLQASIAAQDVDADVLRLAENVVLVTGWYVQIPGLGLAVVPREGAATAILLLLGLTVVAIGYLWLSQHEEVAA